MRTKYKFSKDCKLVAWTGDNAQSMVGMALKENELTVSIVLPAKSDSYVMFFFYKVIRDIESIDHLCIIPIHRIGYTG